MITVSSVTSDPIVLAHSLSLIKETEYCKLYFLNEEECLKQLREQGERLFLLSDETRPLALARVVTNEKDAAVRLFSPSWKKECVTCEALNAIEEMLHQRIIKVVCDASLVNQSLLLSWQRVGSRQNEVIWSGGAPIDSVQLRPYPLVSHACEGSSYIECLISAYGDSEDRKLGMYEPLDRSNVEEYLNGLVEGTEGKYERLASKAVLEGEVVVGFICVTRRGVESQLFIAELAVRKEFWHRGIGSCLLSAAIDEMRTLGARAMYLQHNRANASTNRLYSKFGFNPVGEEIVYLKRMK